MTRFPFSAIYGLDDVKQALAAAAADPKIKTVLIRGSAGSAKTTAARSSGILFGRKIVNVPAGISEDDLFGCLDTETAIKEGRRTLKKGLMASGHGNILFVDDADLMDRSTMCQMLDFVKNGTVLAERDGISGSYPCDTVLIATAGTDGSEMSPHILDRFDLCAYAFYPEKSSERIEILRRSQAFCRNPEEFCSEYGKKQKELSDSVLKARKILPYVTVSDELFSIITELCGRMGADGHRGDIAMYRTSRALAALAGRDEVTAKDIEKAASLCLVHRRSYVPPPPPEQEEEREENGQNEPEEDRGENKEENREENRERQNDGGGHEDTPNKNPPEPRPEIPDLEEIMFGIGEQFRVIDFLDSGPERIRISNALKGKRKPAESSDGTGRYARARQFSGRKRDLALDATVRAAAPFQKYRPKGINAVVIEERDLREKVRERRTGSTILFVVDASGSLGVRKRMETVKGAVLSMLRESYVKRDRVGMMAFRRSSTELILPPTKSVEYGYRKLKELPTGGKTPLSDALETSAEFMQTYSKSHPGEKCHIALITDGRANVPLSENADANKEVLEIAEKISVPGLRWIVIDASSGYARFGNAEKLAEKLGAAYFSIENLNADRLAESVRAVTDGR